MKDAFKRAVNIAGQGGGRAMLIYAVDQAAKDWYMQFDPVEPPIDDMHLLIPIETIEDAIQKGEAIYTDRFTDSGISIFMFQLALCCTLFFATLRG